MDALSQDYLDNVAYDVNALKRRVSDLEATLGELRDTLDGYVGARADSASPITDTNIVALLLDLRNAISRYRLQG